MFFYAAWKFESDKYEAWDISLDIYGDMDDGSFHFIYVGF